MKTILLGIFVVAISLQIKAQTTYEITWLMNITPEAASITIEEGDTIIWIWGEDDMPHDVSSIDSNAPQGFGSEIMTGIGSTYEFTFNEAVVFDYRCSVHPQQMNGTITVEPLMSIEDKFIKNLHFYPNPVRNDLGIRSLLPIQQVEVYSLQGQRVMTESIDTKQEYVLGVSKLSPGLYFLKVYTDNQAAYVRFVKK